MNYENQKKLNSLITEIFNKENQLLVEKIRELETWKKENLKKTIDYDNLKKYFEKLQKKNDILI
jgi:hypothetical protein